jgi:hypothetical protein
MALRDLEDEPELRIVRGRPREPYPCPPLLAAEKQVLRDSLANVQTVGPCRAWYLPAKHEQAVDRVIIAWLVRYRAQHPAAWDRMLKHTRHSTNADVTGGRGTLKGPPRQYTVWAESTARDKTKRTGWERRRAISALLSLVSEGQRALSPTFRVLAMRWTLCLVAEFTKLSGGSE